MRMILLHAITGDSAQAIEIADFLVKEKLLLNPIIQEQSMGRRKTENGGFESMPQVLLMGKTKALLFYTIDKKLRKKYPDKMPILYSLPIVYMDWEQANELIEETTKV